MKEFGELNDNPKFILEWETLMWEVAEEAKMN